MKKIPFEYRFTLMYLILGFLWILFSDKILGSFIEDHDTLIRVQTYKGWFYVAITALLFYYYLRFHLIKLRNAERKAVESDKLKTAFLQNISHEIRTPMNGIIGFTSLLDDEELDAIQRKEYIDTITKSSNRLLELINQVLDISLIESGSVKVHNKPLRLNAFIADLCESWQSRVSPAVDFSCEQSGNLQNLTILTDEYKLSQILNNIIGNSVKFTGKGHIKLWYKIKDKELVFYVEDTGIGIPKEDQNDVFNSFRKVERAEAEKFYDGAGLGLTICQHNIKLLNGKITFESAADKGTTFRISIPFIQVEGTEEEHAMHTLDKSKDITILVADDEIINFQYIDELVKGSGISLIHAFDGQGAIEHCKKNQNISLVIMDLKMPVVNGIEATKIIRQFRPGLPVIAQSAYLTKYAEQPELYGVFNESITKPFLKEELLNAIARSLKQ